MCALALFRVLWPVLILAFVPAAHPKPLSVFCIWRNFFDFNFEADFLFIYFF